MASDQAPYKEFGKRLRSERERLKLSQQEVADHTGISRMAQANYEHGLRSPPANYIERLLTLSFDVEFLFTGQRKAEEGLDWNLMLRSLIVAERFLLDRLEKTYTAEQKLYVARKVYEACRRSEYSDPDQVDVPDLLTQQERTGELG